MIHYFVKISRFFIYVSLASLLIVSDKLFFPFITGKVLIFRTSVEIALVSFLIYLILNPSFLPRGKAGWQQIKSRVLHPVSLAIIAFAFVFTLTALIGVNPTNSFWSNFERAEGAWQIIHYALFFLLTAILFTSKKDWNRLLWFLLIITGLIILIGFFQFSGKSAISGTFGNPSYLGNFIIFSLFFTYWLFREGDERLNATLRRSNIPHKALLTIIFAALIIVLYKTLTAAAIGAFAIGLMILSILFFKKKVIPVIVLALIGIFYLIQQIQGGNILYSLQSRFWTWGSALAGILERPILGWGVENFPYVFDKYYNANHFGIETWFDRAHNFFLEYLIAGGVVLLIAYLAIFFFYYKSVFKLKNDHWRPFFFVIPLVYLIGGMTLFEVLPLYIILFFFLAFFINYSLGFSEGDEKKVVLKKDNQRESTLSPKPLGAGELGGLQGLAVTESSEGRRWSDLHRVEGRSAFSLIVQIAIFILIILLITSLYFTIYLPFQKNRLLMRANQVQEKSIEQIFNDYEKALKFYSPVGQDELEGSLFLFTFNLFELLKNRESPLLKNKDFVGNLVSFNEQWFQPENYAGVKNLFIFTRMQLKAYQITKDKTYLKRAKELANVGAQLAPSRIEFLRLQFQIADIEKDEDSIKKLEIKLKNLRPDLLR